MSSHRMLSKLIIFTLLLTLVLLVNQATAAIPGGSEGSFSVDNSGAANYQVPILISPGTKGMQPELSLNYSHRGGDGMVGVGWSLQGLSAITRCSSKLKTDPDYVGGVHYDNSDGFCLGGNRLIALTGAYGQDGTEYRTEIETYTKIISHGNNTESSPLWFEVFAKDGKRHIYGNQANARLVPIGVNTIHSWLLERVEDRRGNFYQILYSEDQESWRQPVKIEYTGNNEMGVSPNYAVSFTYTPREKPRTRYVAGGLLPSKTLLQSITTSAGNNLARVYNLTYKNSWITGKPTLAQLQECGSEGECLEPKKFDSIQRVPGLVWNEIAGNEPPTYITDLGHWADSTFLTSTLVDLNGDGLLDWIMAWRDKLGQVEKTTWLKTKEGGWDPSEQYLLPGDGASVLYDYHFNRDEPLKNGLLQDVNGDGLPDWVLAYSYSSNGTPVTVKQTWINTGTGWELDERYAMPDVITDTARFNSGENHGTFVDLNGDGLMDWVTSWLGNWHGGSQGVWINQTGSTDGNVWVKNDQWLLPHFLINYAIMFDQPGSNLDAQFVDLNGDGLPDLLRALKDKAGNISKNTYLNTGQGWQQADEYNLPDVFIDYSRARGMVYGKLIDINGDGLVDWVRAFKDPWGYEYIATFLNTGKGWLENEQYKMQDVIYDYTEYVHEDQRRRIIQRHGSFVDVNSDGLIDWVKSYRARNGGEWHRDTFLNTGSTWLNSSISFPINHVIHDYHPMVAHVYSKGFDHGLFADLNGDGATDWVTAYRDKEGAAHQSIGLNTLGSTNNLIHTFRDELGAEVTVAYKPMTDSAVYHKTGMGIPKILTGDKNTPNVPLERQAYGTYPLRKAVSSKPVVASVKRNTFDKQVPTWRTWDYHYSNSQYDVRYGWQGFQTIEITDNEKEIQRTKSFFQHYPLTRRLASVTRHRKSAGGPVTIPIGKQVFYQYRINGTTAQEMTMDGCDQLPCRVDLQYQVSEQYEVDGNLVSNETLLNDTVDPYGNITQQRQIYTTSPSHLVTNGSLGSEVEGAATVTKEIAYENRTDEWLLGLPVFENTRFTEQGKIERSRKKKADFNGFGEPETLYHDFDKPGLNLTEVFSFDGFGNVVSHTALPPDANERTNETLYDPTGHHAVAEINSLGHRTEMNGFDDRCGEYSEVSDPNGLTTSYQYDQFCRLAQRTAPDGTASTIVYAVTPEGDSSYSISTRTQGQSPVSEHFDLLGRKVRVNTSQLDQTVTTAFEYDMFDRPTGESNPSHGTPEHFTQYQYDLLNRVTEVITADGAKTQQVYEGLTTTLINPLEQVKTEKKGPRGETLAVIDANGQQLSYTYDASGNLLTTTDPQGNTIELQYDEVDRNVAMIDPDMGTWQYGYNGFGELTSQTDGIGQQVTMDYDLLGRIVSQTTSDGTATWEWDTASGGIGQLAMARGNEYDYLRQHSYDELGRPRETTVSVEGSTAYTTNWVFDHYSRLQQVIHPDNIIEDYTYSEDGTLAQKNISQGGNLLSEWQVQEMDGWGHATQEQINGRLVLANTYDPLRGRIDRISASADGHQVQDLSFAWDRIGNLNRRINVAQDQEELFEYDRLSRLIASTINNVTTRVEYDTIGNILWKSDVGSYSYGQNGAGPHAVTNVDTTTAEQPIPFSTNNPAGAYTYNASGNLLTGGERTVEWNGLNMPRRITGPNQVDSYFLYGPEGQRIAKDTADGTLTVYLNEVHELILDANDQATFRLTLPLGSARAEVLVNSEGLQNRYLLLDHLGSTEVILDQDLVIQEQLSFDPWGKRRQPDWSPAEQAIASLTPTGFTGHEMDDETGLINMNARLYDPLLGRFLSADTLIPQPKNLQSFNRYSYVVNNPLRYVDPSGHEPGEGEVGYGDDDEDNASSQSDAQSEQDDNENRGDYDGDGDVDEADNDIIDFSPVDDTPQGVPDAPPTRSVLSQQPPSTQICKKDHPESWRSTGVINDTDERLCAKSGKEKVNETFTVDPHCSVPGPVDGVTAPNKKTGKIEVGKVTGPLGDKVTVDEDGMNTRGPDLLNDNPLTDGGVKGDDFLEERHDEKDSGWDEVFECRDELNRRSDNS